MFQKSFKTAQVLTLLKKPTLDRSIPGNYRSISNLNTVYKLMERLVLVRLMPHLLASGNFNPLQSADRTGHSTGNALLCIVDRINKSTGSKQITTIVNLDISAAFDTVNLKTRLQRLRTDFGVAGRSLKWLESYLSQRTQYAKLGRPCSPITEVSSVLGAILFAVYVSSVGQLTANHGIKHYQC